MKHPSPNIRALARRLIAIEEARGHPTDRQADGAVRVCENLRALLSRLVGVAGFRSILSRALALARADYPPPGAVRIGADGSLEGFDEFGPEAPPDAAGEFGAALVARLLGLLVTFIGPALTLRLVLDGWPDASWDGVDLRIEETS